MIRKLALVTAALTLAGGAVATAQDYTLQATFGEETLNAGFVPDPHTVAVVAGGSIDATTLGNNCRGYIANAPDYQLSYNTTGGTTLHFAFVSPVGTDTTLVINGPDGAWHCDDDGLGTGLDPLVTFGNAGGGTYDVWVGVYSQDAGDRSGTLYITELDPGNIAGGNMPPPGSLPPPVTGTPDPNLPPTFGETTIQAGIPVPPVDLIAGGGIDAFTFNNECRGYIAEAPDYVVNFQTLAGILPLVITSTSQADTTLVVADPGGAFHCNDDTDGLNPEVRFDGPQAGRYAIWVGTYGNENAEATLTITTPGGLGGGGILPKPGP
ncbi:MAG: hypothetical protein AB7O56_12400 [Bauldia sp.]